MTGSIALPRSATTANANERLKQSFDVSLWKSLMAAALLHFLVLSLWPHMTADDLSTAGTELVQMELMPEVEIPPPPDEIVRPAVPVISADLEIADHVTIPPTTFRDNPAGSLPPPPLGRTNVSDQPPFTPYEVRPELRNRSEYLRVLQRSYPQLLRDAGIGGTVVLWVRIDESGAVRETRVVSSSGEEALDRVAQEVMRSTARFSPALNRDQRVPVWIQMPVTFQTR
jgi:TonB family protein